MADDRIRDIPTIQELLTDARDILRFKREFPRQEVNLQELGVDVDQIELVLEDNDIEELTQRIEDLAALPDAFNDFFGSEGWIIYEDMSLEVAKSAVEVAEAGDMAAAESELIDYYDRDTIQWQLDRLRDVEVIEPRIELAEKALDDYEAGRYHASVPVVLALMDGMVQQTYIDAYGESRGFSTDQSDLKAWDSIAGHSTGLEYLRDLMLQGRQKTRTDEISMPYRNGIMHGMDLGYANEVVAAKSWCAFFAASEWARKAEADELEAPDNEEDDRSMWEELLEAKQKYEDAQEIRQAGEEWEPRDTDVGSDVPSDGEPEDYDENRPERALVDFLTFWEQNNYGGMANSLITRDGSTEHPGDISEGFDHIDLKSFELVEINDVAAARTDITVRVEVERFGETVEDEASVTLIRMGDEGQAAIPGHKDGTWTVTNRMVLKSL